MVSQTTPYTVMLTVLHHFQLGDHEVLGSQFTKIWRQQWKEVVKKKVRTVTMVPPGPTDSEMVAINLYLYPASS